MDYFCFLILLYFLKVSASVITHIQNMRQKQNVNNKLYFLTYSYLELNIFLFRFSFNSVEVNNFVILIHKYIWPSKG